MTNGSGVSRGDRNRNARLVRLRTAVPVTNAIVGIDLADRSRWSWSVTTTQGCWPARRSGVRRGTWVLPWTGPATGRRGLGLLG